VLLPDLERALRRVSPNPRLYGEELNHPSLIRATRAQFEADGVPCRHLAVVSGALDGIERVLREHLRAGDRVLVEDPGFTGITDLLHALALIPVPVDIDDEGMLPPSLDRALRGELGAVIVTPRAQNPTGAALTARRARQLRAILRRRPELLLIEDDHAGPIAGAPYVSLLEPARERWAVVRSVSKSLGPDLRVAFLASDPRTHARVEGRQRLGVRWVSHVLQSIVAALLSDRNVRRDLAAAAKTYSDRREALLAALAACGIEAHGESGLNVWIPLREETPVVQALLQRGWAVQAGERYRLKSGPAIRVTVSTLHEADARRFADDLAVVTSTGTRTSAA
jgi:DNA-binding transcriptional MocR family regulator